MKRRWAAVLGVAAATLVPLGCSGKSTLTVFERGGAGQGAGAGEAGAGVAGASAGGAGSGGLGGFAGLDAGLDAGGASGFAGAGAGGTPPFVDPSCPDAEAPPGIVECDLFGTPSGCPANEGCYPYIDHPFGMGCDQQTHGAICRAAGSGEQGDACGDGTSGCAPGFICIVGAQAGKHCLRVCALDGSLPCPAGLVCGETDARGVGVCA